MGGLSKSVRHKLKSLWLTPKPPESTQVLIKFPSKFELCCCCCQVCRLWTCCMSVKETVRTDGGTAAERPQVCVRTMSRTLHTHVMCVKNHKKMTSSTWTLHDIFMTYNMSTDDWQRKRKGKLQRRKTLKYFVSDHFQGTLFLFISCKVPTIKKNYKDEGHHYFRTRKIIIIKKVTVTVLYSHIKVLKSYLKFLFFLAL